MYLEHRLPALLEKTFWVLGFGAAFIRGLTAIVKVFFVHVLTGIFRYESLSLLESLKVASVISLNITSDTKPTAITASPSQMGFLPISLIQS